MVEIGGTPTSNNQDPRNTGLNPSTNSTIPHHQTSLIEPDIARQSESPADKKNRYISVKLKFIIAQLGAISWALLSVYISLPWIHDLNNITGPILTIFIIGGIAIAPGYASAFLLFSLMLDRRPAELVPEFYPPITILIAAYNEEATIVETLTSIVAQKYSGDLEIIVINDGSKDGTIEAAASLALPGLRIISLPNNTGKATALNTGLQNASHDIIITVDADTYLYQDALTNIVARYLCDPPRTVAIAGAICARNSRTNLLTRLQEWDYFHGIAMVKRIQSLYQGTLVAQGAFSLYSRKILNEVGGWPTCVGEDIVLSWAMLKNGYRIGYAENAIVFTVVPEHYGQLFQQRRRWARGMIEAMKAHPEIFFVPRLNIMFFYLNALFPWFDLAYLTCFVPGVIAALFGFYLVAGPMTIALVPLAIVANTIVFRVQRHMFRSRNLKIRRNISGLLLYMFFAQLILAPASVAGYISEMLQLAKNWGTK